MMAVVSVMMAAMFMLAVVSMMMVVIFDMIILASIVFPVFYAFLFNKFALSCHSEHKKALCKNLKKSGKLL